MSDINCTGALEAERLKHASSVVNGERVVVPEIAELVEDMEWEGPFVGRRRLRVSDFVLLTDIPDEFIEEEATSETTAAPQKKLYSGVVGDKKKPVKVATVSLPARAANYLLIWSRLGPDRYSVIAMPDDPVSQPVDSLRFVNLTRAPVVMQIKEGAVLQLKPGAAQVVETKGREVFPFKALAGNPDGVHELLSNVVETRNGLRRTVLLLVSKAAEVGGSPAQDPIFTFFTFTNPVDVVPTPPK